MNIAMNCVSVIAILIVVGCVVFTKWNQKNHPEKYRGQQGNALHILFGDFTRKDQYTTTAKKGHIRGVKESFQEANARRTEYQNETFEEDTILKSKK